MKYFKFAQISAESGISWVIEQPVSGPSFPDQLTGLSFVINYEPEPPYYLGAADDSATATPENYIFEITQSEFANYLKTLVNKWVVEYKEEAYTDEKGLRDQLFKKYHDTASLAGIYKYEQAKLLVADSTAPAVDIRAEAAVRGCTPLALAQLIITNHEEFRDKEAKISGLRGMIIDRLTNFVFNESDPVASYREFTSNEAIGTTIVKQYNPTLNIEEDVEEDYLVGKYRSMLGQRYDKLS